jgi:NCS1 family nucleobase:cation symporter-1
MTHILRDGEDGDGNFELRDVTVSEPLLSEQAVSRGSLWTTTPSSWCSYGKHLLRKLEISSAQSTSNAQSTLINHDLRPVEPTRREWGPWNFVYFWIADSFNINTWMIASTMITGNGLSWWQAWICVWVGYSIVACFVCLTGRIGAVYHISFPVATRASFGIWGALWPVLNRTVMACIWSVKHDITRTCLFVLTDLQ